MRDYPLFLQPISPHFESHPLIRIRIPEPSVPEAYFNSIPEVERFLRLQCTPFQSPQASSNQNSTGLFGTKALSSFKR